MIQGRAAEACEEEGVGLPGAGRWFVLHTKSRQEKSVARDLRAMGVGHYLPLVRSVRYYGRRKAAVEVPLFPGYVFLRGERDDAFRADRTGRVVKILPVPDEARLEGELEQVRVALGRGVELDPHPYLRCGMRVEVRSGPLKGVRGLITEKKRRSRLVLQVQVLSRASSLEIDGSLLEVVEPEPALV